MDWFLYDNGLHHERVNRRSWILRETYWISKDVTGVALTIYLNSSAEMNSKCPQFRAAKICLKLLKDVDTIDFNNVIFCRRTILPMQRASVRATKSKQSNSEHQDKDNCCDKLSVEVTKNLILTNKIKESNLMLDVYCYLHGKFSLKMMVSITDHMWSFTRFGIICTI